LTPLPALARLLRRLAAAAGEASWRRIRFTTAGVIFILGALAVGFAAVNTGNNLLYLLLGAMLGATGVSGWVSEQTIRGVEVERHIPRGVPVGQEVVIGYSVRNRKSRSTSLALELHERGLPGIAFVPRLRPDQSVTARSGNTFVRRGVYPLEAVTLSTTFPFGFFRKERDIRAPGEIVIWPRTDRPVGPSRPGPGRGTPGDAVGSRHAGPRGEFRGLRDYRWGDDARDIHWRSTARRAKPVVREYDRDVSDTLWYCLDLQAEPNERAESAVEIVASLCAQASAQGRRFGLAAGDSIVPPAVGVGHLERILDALARVDFSRDTPFTRPPVDPAECVLVSGGTRPGTWAGVHRPDAPIEAVVE
jgi:uncharacterized protein (DUF58 family)